MKIIRQDTYVRLIPETPGDIQALAKVYPEHMPCQSVCVTNEQYKSDFVPVALARTDS